MTYRRKKFLVCAVLLFSLLITVLPASESDHVAAGFERVGVRNIGLLEVEVYHRSRDNSYLVSETGKVESFTRSVEYFDDQMMPMTPPGWPRKVFGPRRFVFAPKFLGYSISTTKKVATVKVEYRFEDHISIVVIPLQYAN